MGNPTKAATVQMQRPIEEKRMHASSVRYHLRKTQGLAILAVLAASATAVAAENETNQPATDRPSSARESGASEPAPDAAEPPRAATGSPPWQKAPGMDYWKPGRLAGGSTLEWHGNLETDLGYASYTFSSSNYPPEKFYDYRGRFVVGPVLEHQFGNDHFVRATGQLVGWVRDRVGSGYQINADDIYGQVGKKGVWDIKFGRFMSWTVYRKGLGYDLYTLEDTGALVAPPVEGGKYGVRYEVNNIWYRENMGFSPGRLALHLYPTPWSGIELLGQYARNSSTNENQLGGRAAANVHSDYASVSVGGEYLYAKPGGELSSMDAQGNTTPCDTCGVRKNYGFGGGIVSKPVSFIELGFNAAMGFERQWTIGQGEYNKNAEATITAEGGYVQVDVAKPLSDRSLILGFGPNFTTKKTVTEDKETHLQLAFYVAYPLGFNNAFVKVVVTNSRDNLTPVGTEAQQSNVFAARVRFAMYF
jgi:hypothetical protein